MQQSWQKNGRRWPREWMIQGLLRFYLEQDRWPTYGDFGPNSTRPPYLPHHSTIWREFGGLDLACHAAEKRLPQVIS